MTSHQDGWVVDHVGFEIGFDLNSIVSAPSGNAQFNYYLIEQGLVWGSSFRARWLSLWGGQLVLESSGDSGSCFVATIPIEIEFRETGVRSQ